MLDMVRNCAIAESKRSIRQEGSKTNRSVAGDDDLLDGE